MRIRSEPSQGEYRCCDNDSDGDGDGDGNGDGDSDGDDVNSSDRVLAVSFFAHVWV